jgi:hypothetical protein
MLTTHPTCVVQERQVAGTLNGPGEGALVASACTCLTAGADLALFCDIAAQHLYLLVIDTHVMIGAELANARLGIEAPPAALFLSFFSLVRFFHFLIS